MAKPSKSLRAQLRRTERALDKCEAKVVWLMNRFGDAWVRRQIKACRDSERLTAEDYAVTINARG